MGRLGRYHPCLLCTAVSYPGGGSSFAPSGPEIWTGASGRGLRADAYAFEHGHGLNTNRSGGDARTSFAVLPEGLGLCAMSRESTEGDVT